MRFMPRTLIICSLVAALVGCSSTGGINEPTELTDIEQPAKIKRLWKASTASSSENQVYQHIRPILVGEYLYSASAKGVVQGFDRLRGKSHWRSDIEAVISSGLASNGKALFVGTSKGELVALDITHGEALWRQGLGCELMSTPAATLSLVVARCGNGAVFGLDSESGKRIWSYQRSLPSLTLRGESVPVIADDKVILGSSDGRLFALSIYDGSVIWETAIATPQGRTDLERMVDVDGTPVVIGDTVYAAAHQGQVVALSLYTGSLQWSRDIGSSVGVGVDVHHLYVVDDSDQVWALDRRNGASLWKQDGLKYRNLTSPTRVGNGLVVGDFDGFLHWISLDDGKIFARHQVADGGIGVEPLVVDNTLYVRSKTGRLEALSLVE